METIINLIANNGFAIVVAVYFMVNVNKTLQQLSTVIQENTLIMRELLGVERGEDK
jgi:hypothetical protein